MRQNKRRRKTCHIRFAWPWYYQPAIGGWGNWFIAFWDRSTCKGFPEKGFRILGIEYWEQYYKSYIQAPGITWGPGRKGRG